MQVREKIGQSEEFVNSWLWFDIFSILLDFVSIFEILDLENVYSF